MTEDKLSALIIQAEQAFTSSNFDFSSQILERILEIDPQNARGNELLAYIYGRNGDEINAHQLLKKACLSPNVSWSALYEIGSLSLQAGDSFTAIEYLKRSLEKNYSCFEAWHDLGTAYASLGNFIDSISAYQTALKIRDDSPELFYNLAKVYEERKEFLLAVKHYSFATSLNPKFSEAWHNQGGIYLDFKQYENAFYCLNRAMVENPNINFLRGDYLHLCMKMSFWDTYSTQFSEVERKILSNKDVIAPFPLLSLTDNTYLQKKCAENYVQNKYPENLCLGPIPIREKKQKIRIGYYSADFHNHATTYLIAELFELHDKLKFEIFAFSFGPNIADEMRARVRDGVDRFIDVSKLSDLEVAKMSRDLEIDIAVDLKGHTKDSRFGIFSFRAAPIQVNYLGFPGTSGANYIDYIIADKFLIPPSIEDSYTEKIVFLPNCYQVNDRSRFVENSLLSRQDLGLPEDGFIFCCFNENYKISPNMFDIWMEILDSVEGSALWLFQGSQISEQNLKIEAAKRGIDGNRIIFAEFLPHAYHLSRYKYADLFLDTFPYNAHTTASDALWAELPALTLSGNTFASRVAGSLLSTLDLSELITTTAHAFKTQAIEIATNKVQLAQIKKNLKKNKWSTPLFDTPLFTKGLECAYSNMMDAHLQRREPENIYI